MIAPQQAADRRYTVICNHYIGRRRVDRPIARNLTWDTATVLSETMQSRERARKENWSSWTGRIFIRELEK